MDRGAWNGYSAHEVTKLYDVRGGNRIDGQRAVALTGDANVAMAMLAWLRGGEMIRFPDAEWNKSCGLIVTVDRKIFRMTTGMTTFEPVEAVPFADGGGHEYALGAMLAGASAKRAVLLVAKRTSMSWGGVDCLRITRSRR